MRTRRPQRRAWFIAAFPAGVLAATAITVPVVMATMDNTDPAAVCEFSRPHGYSFARRGRCVAIQALTPAMSAGAFIPFTSNAEIAAIGRGVLDLSLPKPRWTHAAHFAVALWLLSCR